MTTFVDMISILNGKCSQGWRQWQQGGHIPCCSNRLRRTFIVSVALKDYLTPYNPPRFRFLKPHCVPYHHLAWFYTVIILIQTVKDVTAGLIWHRALTVDWSFNRYCDLYQSNDVVTGRRAFWREKRGHTKCPSWCIQLVQQLYVSVVSVWYVRALEDVSKIIIQIT